MSVMVSGSTEAAYVRQGEVDQGHDLLREVHNPVDPLLGLGAAGGRDEAFDHMAGIRRSTMACWRVANDMLASRVGMRRQKLRGIDSAGRSADLIKRAARHSGSKIGYDQYG
jgi:hypothetical protein